MVVLFVAVVCVGLCIPKKEYNYDYLRLHIRANSNSSSDQYIKYLIKDKVVELLSPMLLRLDGKSDAEEFMSSSKNVIEEYSNYLLKKYGYDYAADVEVGCEYFEEKEIDGKVFPAGEYRSMIVKLGEAKGNNWWGLIYPNLSYIDASAIPGGDLGDEIVYRSKIVEIYNSLTK